LRKKTKKFLKEVHYVFKLGTTFYRSL